MKAEDIRVGDYLMVEPSKMVIKIAAIHNKKVGYHATQNKLEWVRMSLVRPIPITPEILLKNGFQEGASHYILYDDREDNDLEPVRGYEIRFYPGNNFCSIQNLETEADISFYCEYIHQLQQAMRLCGIEKEITLN